METLYLFVCTAFPDGKPLRTFPGYALFAPHFLTETRFALFLEMLCFHRIS
ncbi:hypothetical protein QM996_18515 [Sinorhizobium chiapasense]